MFRYLCVYVLVAIDSFGGVIGRSNGYTPQLIRKNESAIIQWFHRPYGIQRFQGYGTGIAFINAVRLADRSVWRADPAQILLEVRSVLSGFKAEDLLEKVEPTN